MSAITLRSDKELPQQCNIARFVDVVEVQPPLPSIVQPLQPPIITANKLQAKQNERLLQDLEKLGDFYEHLVKHSTLRFLLKKPPKDMALKLSNLDIFHTYLEIDRTFHRLVRSPRSSEVANSSSINNNDFASNYGVLIFDSANFDSNLANFDSNLGVCISKFSLDNMANNNRTLKELATSNFGLIHLLPKLHGLVGEDPHKYLKEFHIVCSTIRPHGTPEDYIKMKTFPFSLDGAAKNWLYLQPTLFNT
ncbi:hypothetical protein CR513_18210, partial [Mucuna pruriens]